VIRDLIDSLQLDFRVIPNRDNYHGRRIQMLIENSPNEGEPIHPSTRSTWLFKVHPTKTCVPSLKRDFTEIFFHVQLSNLSFFISAT
jgi:hypothetical protein